MLPAHLRLSVSSLLIALPFTAPADHHGDQPIDLGREMALSAAAMLGSFGDDLREAALIPLTDEERTSFHYVPLDRQGARFKDMNARQRAATLKLVHTALSNRGSLQAMQIMELEGILGEIEGRPDHRDPEKYWIAIFGAPGEMPWGWRFEGHHLSINQTLTPDGISGTPLFFGANPGKVPAGQRNAGQQVLRAAEDLARDLLGSLDAPQQQQAIISSRVIGEIITGQESAVEPLDNDGIAWGALDPEQQERLQHLVRHYLTRHADEISADGARRIVEHGYENLVFAWAGSTEVGEAHYYRVQGPTFVIEYANRQNGANHPHTVFRDFENDFGRDLLRDHLRKHH